MKRIGIFTYHVYDNYGAVLQAYALQTYITTHLNADVDIVNFFTKDQESKNDIFKVKQQKSLRQKLSTIYHKLPLYPALASRRKKFQAFRKSYLNLTRRYYSEQELFGNLASKDIYITGSDQVFHPYADYSDVYYLGFKKGKAKKVGYAPSFGVTNSELLKYVDERLQNYLRDFDALSCREQNGADFLKRILGKDVSCVVDPVFLLSKEEWNRIVLTPNEVKKYNGKYIFVYRLIGGKPLMDLANKISSYTGLPVVCISMAKPETKGFHMIYNTGPQEILGLIKNASYVITDSFHGTALSLVFGNRIISYISKPNAADRITTIMDRLSMSDKVVADVEKFDVKSLEFADYEAKLNGFIDSSKKYLELALS